MDLVIRVAQNDDIPELVGVKWPEEKIGPLEPFLDRLAKASQVVSSDRCQEEGCLWIEPQTDDGDLTDRDPIHVMLPDFYDALIESQAPADFAEWWKSITDIGKIFEEIGY